MSPKPSDLGKPRIGVFICHCGTNIAGFIDVKAVVEYAAKQPNVVYATDNKYMCSEPGQALIRDSIKEYNLNRVIVASCSPRMHEPTFRKTLESGGLNPYLFEMANIREQCSWVHMHEFERATGKAKALVASAIAKVQLAESLTPPEFEVIPSALVIGGGIAGIQASLDLANKGFKVYLVEKTATIGGHMAQLDKTFPTLDCAACILTPKMVDVARHPNITLLTYSEVKKIEGFVGNFKVTVVKKPRYIDEAKCTSCGDCAKECPVSMPNEFDMGLSLRKAVYLPFPQAVPNIFVIDKRGVSPCRMACPAGVNVQGYIALTMQEKFEEALELIRTENPLPVVCSRVCFRPCEAECERAKVDEPLAINALKRFLVDFNLKKGEKPAPIPKRYEEKVAIIGSGPAGLTAACKLAEEGYPVTVFEQLPEPGGMLRAAIPQYRLPKAMLNTDIEYIQNLGVEIKTNMMVGKDLTFEELSKLGYKAVFIAIGAQKSAKLGVEGEDLEGVMHALDFLRNVNLGGKVKLGDKVVVVGGGNVAVDAARTSLRLGAKEVNIVYRRSRAEMPANSEEVKHAEVEGVKICFLASPKRILGRDGRVVGMECIRMELGPPDESGRRRPIPIKGSEFIMEVDTVIIAIGEVPDTSMLPRGIKLTKWNTIEVDPVTLETSLPGFFAGGDVVSGPATVVEAIAAGKRAAVSIDRYLRGEELKAGRDKIRKKVEEVPKEGVERKPRQPMPLLPLKLRLSSFQEVETGFTKEIAMEEAGRCLQCGGCSECLACEKVCEPKAIIHEQVEEEVKIDVGTIIIATGYDVYDAKRKPEYGYGLYKNVITNLEFERLVSSTGPTGGTILRPSDGKPPKRVAFIQCVGSRDANENLYCSRICCIASIKHAHQMKERYPDAETCIFYIDLRTFGKGYEEFLERSQREGVRLVRGRVGEVVELPETKNLLIRYEDTLRSQIMEAEFDMVVLATALIPRPDAVELQKMLKLSLGSDGFFIEAHPKLRPVETYVPGIYLCGTAQGPKDIPDTVVQASAAASQASILLLAGKVRAEPLTAYVAEDYCGGCGVCEAICPYKAISLVKTENGGWKAEVNEALCQGCGSCGAACPAKAITTRGYTEPQLLAQLEALLSV